MSNWLQKFTDEFTKDAARELAVLAVALCVAAGGYIRARLKKQPGKKTGTVGYDYHVQDVSDAEWKKIAKAGKNNKGLVALRHQMHSTYEGRKLTQYTVDIDYINYGTKDCAVVKYDLFPLLLLPGANGDGMRQKVELKSPDAVQLGDPKLLPNTHYRMEVWEYAFRFDQQGIKANVGLDTHRTLSLLITIEYKDEAQAMAVSLDTFITAEYCAIRKLVTSADFTRGCLPKNPQYWVAKNAKDSEDPNSEQYIDLEKGNICQATYYGVHKQPYCYGMVWSGWQKK